MANKEISGLTAGSACAAADLFHSVQGGNSRKVTGAQLQTFCGISHPGYVAGRWYPALRASQAAGTAGQNLIQFTMFVLARPVTISDLGCVLGTAQASNNCQLAIYAADTSTFYPTGNALAATGDISVASGTCISGDITGANVTLPAGTYFAAVNHSGATSTVAGVAAAFSQNSGLLGSATFANLSSSSTIANLKLTFVSTYATWPDMTGQTLTETTASTGIMLYFKAA